MNWPTTCNGCGTTYSSPDDSSVHVYIENPKYSRKRKAFVCLNCIEPIIFQNSRWMKELIVAIGINSTKDRFLGREEVTDKTS